MTKKEESKKDLEMTGAKKSSVKKTTKKTASKKAPSGKKTPVKSSSPANQSRKKATPKKAPDKIEKEKNRTPIYVLMIMGLLTAIIILVNNQQYGTSSIFSLLKKKSSGQIIKSEDFFSEKKKNKEISKKSEKRNKTSKKAKKADNAEKKKTIIVKKEQEDVLNIKIYFVRFNEKTEGLYLSSVKRKVKSKSKLRDAISFLIKGPSPYERKVGVLSSVPHNLKIRSLDVKGRTAVVDFNSAIEYGATGSMLLKRIDQIVYTATQFNEIDNVRIKINGRYRNTLGSDGFSIGGPLHRR